MDDFVNSGPKDLAFSEDTKVIQVLFCRAAGYVCFP